MPAVSKSRPSPLGPPKGTPAYKVYPRAEAPRDDQIKARSVATI